MKLYFHFGLSNFSNSYLLGPEERGNALIIDPGIMDLPLLNLIEKNNFYIQHILVTHNHSSHVNGIKTLKKIYDADIYSNMALPFKCEYTKIEDGDRLELDSFTVDVINIPGHSPDSMVFKIKNMLFTGDALSAGEIDHDLTIEQVKLLRKKVNEKIYNLDEETLVFPGHGAPTTIKVEKAFNPYLQF